MARILLLAAPLLLLAACETAPVTPATAPNPPPPDVMNLPDDDIVAVLNGKPVMRREVTERAMAAEPKRLIDDFIKWRVRVDRVREVGIENTPDEISARAHAILDDFRRANGEEALKKQLAETGLTEAQYVDKFARTAEFAERVAVEKAIVYDLIVEGSVEFDAAAFTTEEHAQAFHAKVKAGGDFDEVVKQMQAEQLKVGRWRRMRVSKELAIEPLQASDWILKHLLELKDGQLSGVEQTVNKYCLVLRCAKAHAPRPGAKFADVRKEVLDEILLSRIQEQQITAWSARLLKSAKVEYKVDLMQKK